MSSFPSLLLAALSLSALAAAPPVSIRTQALPLAAIGAPYRVELAPDVDGRCIDGGASYSIVRGELPLGLELRANVITGIPQELGDFPIRIHIGDDCGRADRDFLVRVSARPILRVSPDTIELAWHAGAPVPEMPTLLVSSPWPLYRYTLMAGKETWLRARPQAGMTPREGSSLSGDPVHLTLNPEGLTPGDHDATLLVAAPHADAVPVHIRLHVN